MRRDEFTSTTLCQLRKLTKFIVSCKNQTNKQTKIKHFTSRITLSYRTVVALISCYGIGQHRRHRRAGQKKKDIVKERNGRKLWSAVCFKIYRCGFLPHIYLKSSLLCGFFYPSMCPFSSHASILRKHKRNKLIKSIASQC